MIKAFVGSGGKTGTIMKQASQYRAQGLRVLVTTSTQMGAREGTIIGDDPTPIIEALNNGYAMAGQRANREGKIGALSEETFRQVAKHADVVLVEADGSRQLPLKFPAAHEPVIPDGTDEIVVVCGLSAIGKHAKDVCHRLELVKPAIGIGDETIITGDHVQRLIRAAYLEPLGAKHPGARLTVHPCQRDTLYLRAVAALLMADEDVNLIKEEWFRAVAVFGTGAAVLEIVLGSEDGKRIGGMKLCDAQGISRPQIKEDADKRTLLLPLEHWVVTRNLQKA